MKGVTAFDARLTRLEWMVTTNIALTWPCSCPVHIMTGIARVERDLHVLEWMVGTNIVLTIVVLGRLFTR